MNFDPIVTARNLDEAYRAYLGSTLRFANPGLQGQFEEQMLTKGILSKGPLLEATPPYSSGATLQSLVDEGVLSQGVLRLGAELPADRRLYTHQEEAVRNARAGRNQVVVTGTGSGKTECFLLPILDHLLREEQAGTLGGGVRALILYPMNALANDQLKRLRRLLADVPEITFGRYTGETKNKRTEARRQWSRQHPDVAPLPNELLSREEMRETPPHILLTNYAMLEYLLLRPTDAPIFEGLFKSTWSHLVVDEAHVYSGTLGTEIAYLLRRLKARLGVQQGTLRCFATSATIGTTESDFQQVARFASDLFGETFGVGGGAEPLDVVTSTPDTPEKEFSDVWGRLDAEDWRNLAALVEAPNAKSTDISAALPSHVPSPLVEQLASAGDSWPVALGRVLLGEGTSQELLLRLLCAPLDVADPKDLEWSGEPLPMETLSAAVQVLSRCERSQGMQLLSARYHSFFRAPEGAFVGLVGEPKLFLSRQTLVETPLGKSPAYEISTCRHCGQEYILGHKDRPRRDESGAVVEVLSPEPPRESEDSDVPGLYYMLMLDLEASGAIETDEDQEDAVGGVQVEVAQWLCPLCGTLHSDPASRSGHAFVHEPVPMVGVRETKVREDDKRACARCGYKSANAIQRVRVSPEAAGSVMVYDLVRELPPIEAAVEPDPDDEWYEGQTADPSGAQAGSLICFSDRRQDAAFFAPSLERTYGAITSRQILYRAAGAFAGQAFTPSDWQRETARLISENRYLDGRPSVPTIRKTAWAWVLAELMSEDGRASLEGLGLLSYRTRFVDQLPVGPLLREPWCLSEAEARSLLQRLVGTLRDARAIQWQEGITKTDGLLPDRWSPVRFVKQRTGKATIAEKSWLPSSPGVYNSRLDFVSRLLLSKGCDPSGVRETAARLISEVWRVHLFGSRSPLRDLLVIEGDELSGSAQALPDLWEMVVDPTSGFARCRDCGRLVIGSDLAICPTWKCDGRLIPVDPQSDPVDAYYRSLYRRDEPVPITIEEHTGQLESQHAARIQERFLRGDVNVLSCTTTFELGVDVGELRSVFMRNVPPTPANYVQRAGRTGRRTGAPGYALTFARLRSHDLAYYVSPERMISGRIPAPACYLSNEKIAERHVYAVALSAFFRDRPENEEYCRRVSDFFSPEDQDAQGLAALREFLERRPAEVSDPLDRILPPAVADALGTSQWAWVEGLVGEQGRVSTAYRDLMRDWDDLSEEKRYRLETGGRVDQITAALSRIKTQLTIAVLAAHGALPKYGFPTDLAELALPHTVPESAWLEMQRGLRTAIYEYAPGSEVVALKKVWRSTALKRIPGKTWDTRAYWVCRECGHFQTRAVVGDLAVEAECPVCASGMGFGSTYVVPEFGFIGELAAKRAGEKRPRASGGVRIYFDTAALGAAVDSEAVTFPGGQAECTYARNGRLYALNLGPMGAGFTICPQCGGAGPTGARNIHRGTCNGRPHGRQHLGTSFSTDVMQLALAPSDSSRTTGLPWDALESALWACVLSASEMLVVPESELGGTAYWLPGGKVALLLYDDVPGGAGRVQSLQGRIVELFERARLRISGDCGCGEDTSCYGCLRSYANQFAHDRLSRSGASAVLNLMLE